MISTLEGFAKTSDGYIEQRKHVNLALIAVGASIAGLPVWLFVRLVADGTPSLSLMIFLLPTCTGLGLGLFLIALGLVRSRIRFDLKSRQARIEKMNFLNRRRLFTFPLDDIQVNAVRLGATPGGSSGVSSRERWIAKAGFQYENYDAAIYSKETRSFEECRKHMVELYHFFFPDRTDVTENNVLTNGNEAYVLSDEEKEEFLRKQNERAGKKEKAGDDDAVDLDSIG